MIEETQTDRRLAPRYTPKNEVFVVFRPSFDRLGQVKDVSLRGAAFEYPVFANYEEVAEVEVDLFTSEPAPFMLRSVPCEVVYDIKLQKPTLSGIVTRRCGLKFTRLSEQHSEELEFFLDKYGSPALPGV
jgi:hypothetical protein